MGFFDTIGGYVTDKVSAVTTSLADGWGNSVVSDLVDVPNDATLTQSKYDFRSRVFPSDLGEQSYNGHYMVININVQKATAYNEVRHNGIRRNTFEVLPDELSKTDALRFNIDPTFTGKTGINGAGQVVPLAPSGVASLGNLLAINPLLWTQYMMGNLPLDPSTDQTYRMQLPRQTRRIVESIALYMPNTVVFDTNNDYEDISITQLGGQVINTVQGFLPKPLKALSKGIDLAKDLTAAGAKMIQKPINPKVEVLFRNTTQRTFLFEFMLAPQTFEESQTIDQIIRTLRFHAAPETQTLAGFVYVPPSEFDITFYNKGRENINIPRINTCALTKINVDYAPQGVYSTFSTGAPVAARMTLEFRELEIVTKLRVAQGF